MIKPTFLRWNYNISSLAICNQRQCLNFQKCNNHVKALAYYSVQFPLVKNLIKLHLLLCSIAASGNLTMVDRGAFCVQGPQGTNGVPGKNGKDGLPGRDGEQSVVVVVLPFKNEYFTFGVKYIFFRIVAIQSDQTFDT